MMPTHGNLRVIALSDKARAYLDAAERVAPCDLFTQEQYDAIRNAGLDVFFVRADVLLGATA